MGFRIKKYEVVTLERGNVLTTDGIILSDSKVMKEIDDINI